MIFRRTSEPQAPADALRTLRSLWRPAWESRAALAHAAAGAAVFSFCAAGLLPARAALPAGGALLLFSLVRARGALAVWRARLPLFGRAPAFMGFGDVAAVLRRMSRGAPPRRGGAAFRARERAARRTRLALSPVRGTVVRDASAEPPVDGVWFGLGFPWGRAETQRLYELMKVDVESLKVPEGVRRRLTRERGLSDEAPGLGWIHGVGGAESGIVRPLSSLGGGTLIVGTTQAGKGVVMTNLAAQAILRGDVVIVIDPKSSKRLRGAVIEAARAAGRDEALEFHPAFPARGIRLDPLGSFTRATELASRITAVMPPDSGGAFTAFAWQAVHVAVSGMLFVEEKPTLAKLAHAVSGGIDELLERALARDLDLRRAGWRSRFEPESAGRLRGPAPDSDPKLVALVQFWLEETKGERHPVVSALVQTWRHNREHYQKITASLQPVLAMLTAGPLRETLSPDPDDPTDDRPILTLERVVRSGGILYLGLDALPDATVASALGSILLADLAALAGKRYNSEESGAEATRISLFVDETANVINQPLIEILNKGMEAGLQTVCAMQTIADLAARLGSEARARMALGNLNNLIALRTKDLATQRFVAEAFGKAVVWGADAGIATQASGLSPAYRTTVTRSIRSAREELVPIDLLGKLPNGEFFAALSGGRIYKGRMPILLSDRRERMLLTERGELRPDRVFRIRKEEGAS